MRDKWAWLCTGRCGKKYARARVTPLSLKHVKSKNQDKIGKNWGKKIARFLFWMATNNSKPHLKLERPAKFA